MDEDNGFWDDAEDSEELIDFGNVSDEEEDVFSSSGSSSSAFDDPDGFGDNMNDTGSAGGFGGGPVEEKDEGFLNNKKTVIALIVLGVVILIVLAIAYRIVMASRNKEEPSRFYNDTYEDTSGDEYYDYEEEPNYSQDEDNYVQEDVRYDGDNGYTIDENGYIVDNSGYYEQDEPDDDKEDTGTGYNQSKWELFSGDVELSFSDYITGSIIVTNIRNEGMVTSISGDRAIRTIVEGSVSGLSGTYELEVPYTLGRNLEIGSEFKIKYKLAEMDGYRVVTDFTYVQ